MALWALIAAALTVAAFVGVVWLTKPWSEVALAPTTTSSPTPTVTARPILTPTPSRTPLPLPSAASGPSPTAQPTSAFVLYTVAAGDSLETVAARFGVEVQELVRLNELGPNAVLRRGQELVVPRSDKTPLPPAAMTLFAVHATQTASGILYHTVQEGDLLGSIAMRYQVDSEEIAAANNIRLDSILSIGQRLIIPRGIPWTGTPASRAATATPGKGTTVPPTPTPLPTETSTPTPTLTPTLVHSPTPEPTSPYIYRAPSLLAPTNGSLIVGPQIRVVLNWTSVGVLNEDEWYLVRVWRADDDVEAIENWTKATSWRLPVSMYPKDEATHHLIWQVLVAVRGRETAAYVAMSPPSTKYEFTWQ